MKKTLYLTGIILSLCFLLDASNIKILADNDLKLKQVDSFMLENEVEEINNEIQDRKNRIQKVQDKQKKYSQAIAQKQKDKSTLNSQLAILDNRLAKAELDIESVQLDIEKISFEISKTEISIKKRSNEIDLEKEKIKNVLQLLHKEEQVDMLEVLLLNNSLADFLTQVKYLENINESVGDSLDRVVQFKDELEDDLIELDKKNTHLAELKIEQIQKKEALTEESTQKETLLVQVQSSETEYQKLLLEAKKEQQEASSEIASLEKLARAKLAQMQGEKPEMNDNGIIWPVPKNTITALFHDPDYPYRHIFEHPAIDIRAGQGTTLKAAASGYVARAKDAGLGYSYIMIIHGNGLSTVYGHVSKIYVKQDEFVVQGQTIGLTGGMPGTPGAGRLTTGPHLHFEVRKEGIPVNPLAYLP